MFIKFNAWTLSESIHFFATATRVCGMWCVGGFIASSAVWMVVCWHMRSYILIRCFQHTLKMKTRETHQLITTRVSRLLYTFHIHSVNQCVWWAFCKRFNVVFIESDSWSVKYAIWYQVDNKTIITLFHVSEERKRTNEKNTPKKIRRKNMANSV